MLGLILVKVAEWQAISVAVYSIGTTRTVQCEQHMVTLWWWPCLANIAENNTAMNINDFHWHLPYGTGVLTFDLSSYCI